MFYQSCNNLAAVFIAYTELLILITANDFFYFFNCSKKNNVSDMYLKKVKWKR